MKTNATLALLALSVAAFAKPIDLSGTWKIDPKSPKIDFYQDTIRLTLKRDGTLSLKSKTVTGSGTYQLAGDRLTIKLAVRNAHRPKTASESSAQGRVIENGKAILLPTGQIKAGKEVMHRLIRI